MARPQRIGIDYFSFDVDLFDDEKILPISSKYESKGECILIRTLCAIYRNGYYVECTDAFKFKIANQTKQAFELVSDVILDLVKWGFFDKNMYESHNVLTSKGIQNRWKEATRKRIKQKDFSFWLLEFPAEETKKETPKNEFLPEETPLTQPESTQSKLNKSKVNKENIILEEITVATVVATPIKTIKSIEEREKDFFDLCALYVPAYGKEMIREFYDYWTEKSKSGKKLRFEDQKFFDIKRRLVTWNSKNFNKSHNGTSTSKNRQPLTDEELADSIANGFARGAQIRNEHLSG